MTDLKELENKMEQQNPAADSHKTPGSNPEATEFGVTRESRVPMSIPQIKLAVRDIPGYRLYWFKEENIERAIQAGYENVKRTEVFLHRNNVAGSPGVSGNTDLGTNVSLVMGTFENGHTQRLILMKIRLDWYKDDQLKSIQKQAAIIEGIFEGQQVFTGEGKVGDLGEFSYVDQSRTKAPPPIFNRKPLKVKIGRR